MALQQPRESQDDDYPYYEETVTESTWHARVLNYLHYVLDERYRNEDDVFVGANHFIYWEEGNRDKKRAPDIFVCFGARDLDRKSYRIWESGPPPQVVFEVTSESSRTTDQGSKKDVYLALGVEEYYLFDPLGEYIPRKLRGFRREKDIFLPIASETLYSGRLDLELRVEGKALRLYDRPSGEALGSYREEKDLRLLAQQERSQAQQAAQEAQARADRLADRLRQLGIDPESV